ncbi:MAG TPA: helix-turn-helix domain-containing protein [Solirubrobacteraceae bacterium]|jgi:DNA-binding transcriptional ArsR family regulator|nr:helix-turn-helix domain-containing protein [Solirubrobacteraceae bacterium]
MAQGSWLDAVANPIRLQIVRELSQRQPASLDELATSVSAQRGTLRAHLQALVQAGVVARLPGEPDGRRGRPPMLYGLERRELPRGAAATRGAARSVHSPVAVLVRDYPAEAPRWTLREPRWAAVAYLLESPWLAQAAEYVDYDRRMIEWRALYEASRAWPADERFLIEVARGLWASEPRGSVTLVARLLSVEQRARVLAAIALAAGDATIVGLNRPREALKREVV